MMDTSTLIGIGGVTVGIIGLWFAWKQLEHRHLPGHRSLSSGERDILKAMSETRIFFVTSFVNGWIACIIHKERVDSDGIVHSDRIEMSLHYYEACLELEEKALVRKPTGKSAEGIEFQLTPRGKRFLEKHEKKLNKHDYDGSFIDRVSRERERRTKPNTLHGTAHDCIGGEPLGRTAKTLHIAMIIEYPIGQRQSDRLCDVILPMDVNNVQAGDILYLRLNNSPLYLKNEDWLPVAVTRIVENGTYSRYICGEPSKRWE